MQDAAITYTVQTNYGDLYYDYYSKDSYDGNIKQGKQCSYTAGQTILWQGQELNAMLEDGMSLEDVLAKTGRVFVDLVVKADDHIVGCAVFEIIPWNGIGFTVRYLCSEYYPQVDEQYQPITEEFVQQRIAACHQD